MLVVVTNGAGIDSSQLIDGLASVSRLLCDRTADYARRQRLQVARGKVMFGEVQSWGAPLLEGKGVDLRAKVSALPYETRKTGGRGRPCHLGLAKQRRDCAGKGPRLNTCADSGAIGLYRRRLPRRKKIAGIGIHVFRILTETLVEIQNIARVRSVKRAWLAHFNGELSRRDSSLKFSRCCNYSSYHTVKRVRKSTRKRRREAVRRRSPPGKFSGFMVH